MTSELARCPSASDAEPARRRLATALHRRAGERPAGGGRRRLPAAAVDAVPEQGGADDDLEGEADPAADGAEAEVDAEEPGERRGREPGGGDADDGGEADVARAAEDAARDDVRGVRDEEREADVEQRERAVGERRVAGGHGLDDEAAEEDEQHEAERGVAGAEQERAPRDEHHEPVLVRADGLADEHGGRLGERVRREERHVHEVEDELVRGAVDGAHPRHEHGEDQERADLHDELQAVRHALRPHLADGGRPPAHLREPAAHRPRERAELDGVAADHRDRRAGDAQAEADDQDRRERDVDGVAGERRAHRRAGVALAVAGLAERRVDEDQRRAERADREVLGGERAGARGRG